MKHIFSVFDNEQKCIQALLDIHNGGGDIELDPMYNRGMFYRNGLNKPVYRYDLNAKEMHYDADEGDAANLPLPDGSIGCMMLDPPFMFNRHGKTDNNRVLTSMKYTMFDNFNDLETCYKGILKEAHRVLKKHGVCFFKCQDYTDGKTTLTHCYVWQWAQEAGFNVDDLAILNLPMVKVYNGNLKQRHLRKTHCYFFVLKKR